MGASMQHHILGHGWWTLTGQQVDTRHNHHFAHSVRVLEGGPDAAVRRVSGTAQLDFKIYYVIQVQLAELVFDRQTCPWPTSGHAVVASSAKDGSSWDTTFVFLDGGGGSTTNRAHRPCSCHRGSNLGVASHIVICPCFLSPSPVNPLRP